MKYHRCKKCSFVVDPENKYVYDANIFHIGCGNAFKAQEDNPIGYNLFNKIKKNVQYLEDCDPSVILKNTKMLQNIYDSFGFEV